MQKSIKSFSFNIFWGLAGKLVNGLKLLIFGIIIARYAGPELYGLFNYVISFVTLFTIIAEFRIQNIILRELSIKNHDENKILGTSLGTCLIFAVIGFAFVCMSLMIFKEEKDVMLLILLYSSSFFFQSFRFLRAYFISRKLNYIIAKVESLVTVFLALLIVLGIYYNFEISYFIFLKAFDFLLISLFFVISYLIKIGNVTAWRFNITLFFYFVKQSFPLVLSGVSVIVFQKIDQIMIRNMINEESLGQYAAAATIINLITFAPIVLSETATPYLVNILSNKNENYLQFKQKFSDYITWGSIFMSILLIIFSQKIILLAFGSEFQEAITLMSLFSWKGLFVALGVVSGQIMIIENIHHISYIKSIIGAAINIILNIILITKVGIIGAVYASIVAFFVSSYLTHYFIPVYRSIFFLQTRSIFCGLFNILPDIYQIIRGRQIALFKKY